MVGLGISTKGGASFAYLDGFTIPELRRLVDDTNAVWRDINEDIKRNSK